MVQHQRERRMQVRWIEQRQLLVAVEEPELKLHASRADGKILAATRQRNPGCWEGCGHQANNASALCPVRCLFKTMLEGNTSAGIAAMTQQEVVQPFLSAFKAHSD